ncbi:nickel pincer cofactor biosynthesis protein LarC [Vallitalea maricola]|uniref:Nickel pincer cofactor biosynthesis protein LarC n=1 Tax=Vallitalea maricola TaxID=3074433 RepID=A0ACB5UEN2_9FIRM|nr:nickel pincer cofactor biosynthesis protein LarC [Vallitalea sp. AN17-2]
MKILYYDCFAGISGDMNLGALIDLGVDKDYLIEELNKLTISQEFKIKIQTKQKMGITGTKVDVILENKHGHVHGQEYEHKHEHTDTHTHNHEHRNLNSIYKIIDESNLNENVKKLSKDMFLAVAKAEAKVHGKSIEKVHFHEVGAVDSIVDIIGAAICIDNLKVDRIMSSTVELGGGFVKCAHGIIPVPAPATTEILTNIPIHMGKVNSETTTPTGAAILKTIVNEFTDKIDFKIVKIGYGLGTKDFEIPNVLRAFLGEVDDKVKDVQTMLEINIDDMNSELFGYIEDKLFENGALDVYKTPIIMKKGRPAIKLSVLVDSTSLHKIENVLLVETTTLGLRKYTVEKVMLDREFITLSTKYGDIPIKKGLLDGKVIKMKPEYEVCKRLATEHEIPIRTIYDEIYKLT